MWKALDLTGQRFGRLVAVKPTGERKGGCVVWKCKCDCGKCILVRTDYLMKGNTSSCGCLQSEETRKRLSGESGRKMIEKMIEKDCKELTRISMLTMKTSKSNTSGVKGVCWNKNVKKWTAQIKFQGKQIHLGCFDKLEDATLARKEAEEKYFAPILEKYNYGNKKAEDENGKP